MKTTHILLAAVLAATSAVQAATAEHKLPAPLPEFKTPEQLAKWSDEMTAKAAAADALAAKQGNPASSTSAFYTGKPYVQETGSYAFMFRQYDPKLSRWTSTDPSGFPDGANNLLYVNNNALNASDSTGKSITLYQKPVAGQLISESVHSYIYFTDVYAPGGVYNWTGSISGQPEHNPPTLLQGFGNLQSQPGSDNNSPRNAALSLNYSNYGYNCEWAFYKDLLGASQSYDNSLGYNPVPNALDSSYNSNGYIAGILSALGINVSSSTYTSSIGWSRPIPLTYTAQYINNQNCCE